MASTPRISHDRILRIRHSGYQPDVVAAIQALYSRPPPAAFAGPSRSGVRVPAVAVGIVAPPETSTGASQRCAHTEPAAPNVATTDSTPRRHSVRAEWNACSGVRAVVPVSADSSDSLTISG
jgi:hypothetical protein